MNMPQRVNQKVTTSHLKRQAYCYVRQSVMITTNLGFADWTRVFGDPIITATLLDRLTHRAYTINCPWDSYRLKQSIKEKK